MVLSKKDISRIENLMEKVGSFIQMDRGAHYFSRMDVRVESGLDN